MCSLFFLAKCADVPTNSRETSLELDEKIEAIQNESMLNLSFNILNQILTFLIQPGPILRIKPFQLVLRVIFPRLIARTFLNHSVKKRV